MKEKLEIGKDYINTNDLNSIIIVIDRKGDYENNGFLYKEFKDNLLCIEPEIWREATKEEVVEAFKKHLINRYGEDWGTMKIKKEHPLSFLGKNVGLWNVKIVKEKGSWNVWNKNGLLYCNGIWAEKLEEEPKIHINEAIKKYTVIHCETEQEANRILGMAHELGYKWVDSESYVGNTRWDVEESKTYYYLFKGTYGNYDYIKERNYTIIPSTQIADFKKKKSDKKRYKVDKASFSDFKQVSLGDSKTNKIIAHFVEQDEETLLLAEKIVGILNLMEK